MQRRRRFRPAGRELLAPGSWSLISILAIACLIARGPAAFAHAILLEAAPRKGAVVAGPDLEIRLRFNSRIDGARSQVTLVIADKSVRALVVRALALEKQAAPEILSARATGLRPGPHRLRWQVLASDGHITRGEYSFEVK